LDDRLFSIVLTIDIENKHKLDVFDIVIRAIISINLKHPFMHLHKRGVFVRFEMLFQNRAIKVKAHIQPNP
jgi:hypothetical protein